jgi:hypothetical protein
MRVNVCILRHLGADVLQLGFLPVAREGDAAPLVGRLSLFKRGVVELPTQHQDTIKFPLLFGSGPEFVLEGLA